MNKMIWDYSVTLLTAILSAWILKEYFGTFLDKKKENRTNKIRWGIFILWQIFSVLDIFKKPNDLVLLVSILVVLLVAFNYEASILKKIVFVIVYNSVWLLMELMVDLIFIMIDINYVVQESLSSLFSQILLLFLVKALKHFFCNEKIQELPHSYNMVLILIPLGSMFVVYTSFLVSVNSQNETRIFWSIAVLLIMLFINVLIFTIYLKLSKDLELRQKNVIYQQEIDLYNKQMKEKEESMLEFRHARHDLKNKLIYVQQLSESKEYDELQQFVETLIDEAPFDRLTIAKTDNLIVDALVNFKYAMAKQSGIEFTVKLEIPTQLPFDSVNLCIILGNALDNALEANKRSNSKKKYIKLNMRMDKHNLVIVVENSFDGHINRGKEGKILTVKTDRKDHGLGLDSIQRSVNKYHGIMNTSAADHIFVLEILLYRE